MRWFKHLIRIFCEPCLRDFLEHIPLRGVCGVDLTFVGHVFKELSFTGDNLPNFLIQKSEKEQRNPPKALQVWSQTQDDRAKVQQHSCQASILLSLLNPQSDLRHAKESERMDINCFKEPVYSFLCLFVSFYRRLMYRPNWKKGSTSETLRLS